MYVRRHDAIVELIVAAMLHGPFGFRYMRYDLGIASSHTSTLRDTIPRELFHPSQNMQGIGQPDIVLIEDYHEPYDRGNYTVTAESTLNRRDKYKITLLDVHCVSNETKSSVAIQRKEKKLDKTADILRQVDSGHTVHTIPITIGTRIPLIPADIERFQMILGIDKTQARKLYKDIWICNTRHLRDIHIAYYKEQFQKK